MSDDTPDETPEAPIVDEGIPTGLQRGRYRTANNKKSTGKKPYNRFSAAGQGIDVYAAGPNEVETKVVPAPKPKPKPTAETE